MKLIALVGFKQSGKSTAAKYLEEKYGFVRHNFKDSLVAELKQNFPDLLKTIAWEESLKINAEIPIDRLFEMKPPLMRALMINYGTEVRRKENPNYWTTEWYENWDQYTPTVADDVRFLNEAQTIKNAGGKLIRIKRTDIETGGNHQSETEQLEIEEDYLIEVAPGEQEKLYAELDRIMTL
jgi:hypothetical protein